MSDEMENEDGYTPTPEDICDRIMPWACRYLAIYRKYRGEEITDKILNDLYSGCCTDPPDKWYGAIKKIIPILSDQDRECDIATEQYKLEIAKIRKKYEGDIIEAIRSDIAEVKEKR